MSLRERLPWWGRIAAKMALSRLGIPGSAYRRLGLFRHGPMDDPDYVRAVFDAHVARAGLAGRLEGKTLLEIGPGEGVGTAVLAYAHAARAVLVDSGRYARSDLRNYTMLADALSGDGLRRPPIEDARNVDEILSACGARYLTKGLASWGEIPDASVDLIFSQAVLEHVRKSEFGLLLRECKRVLRPTGVCSHRVDLRDHLGGGLNNLRFSERVWESGIFSRSGFYTNRIRYRRMLTLFEGAGFKVDVTQLRHWDALPIKKRQLAPEFRDLPDDELCIAGFDVMLMND